MNVSLLMIELNLYLLQLKCRHAFLQDVASCVDRCPTFQARVATGYFYEYADVLGLPPHFL